MPRPAEEMIRSFFSSLKAYLTKKQIKTTFVMMSASIGQRALGHPYDIREDRAETIVSPLEKVPFPTLYSL